MKVTDPGMIRSLLREDVAHYLAPFLHADHSVAEVSELLRTPLPKVHYWVRSLYAAGVLQVVSEQPRKGRAIKRYRAVATEFVIPAEALPEDHFARIMRRSNAEMTEALVAAGPEWVIGGDFRISASSPLRGVRERLVNDRAHTGASIHQSGCALWITEDDARELVSELNDLRNRWVQRSRDSSDLRIYQLEIALAPIPGQG